MARSTKNLAKGASRQYLSTQTCLSLIMICLLALIALVTTRIYIRQKWQLERYKVDTMLVGGKNNTLQDRIQTLETALASCAARVR